MAFKHPEPADFSETLEDASGEGTFDFGFGEAGFMAGSL